MKKRIFVILAFIIIAIGFSIKPVKDYFQEVAEKKAKLEQETAAQKAKIEQEESIKSKNKIQIDDSITRAKQTLYSVELTKQTIVSDLIGETMLDANAFRVAIEQAIQADFDRTEQHLQGLSAVDTARLNLEITKIQSKEKLGQITALDSMKQQHALQSKIRKLKIDTLDKEIVVLEKKAKKEAAISDISNRLLSLQKIVAAYIEFQKPLSIRNQDGTEQLFQIGIILVDKLPETKNLYLSEIETVRQNIKKVNEIKLSDSTFRTLSFNDNDFIKSKADVLKSQKCDYTELIYATRDDAQFGFYQETNQEQTAFTKFQDKTAYLKLSDLLMLKNH